MDIDFDDYDDVPHRGTKRKRESPLEQLNVKLNGVHLTRPHHLNRLVGYCRERPLTPYWTQAKGDLFKRLPRPGPQNSPYYPCNQKTWFLSLRHAPEDEHHRCEVRVQFAFDTAGLQHVTDRNVVWAKTTSSNASRAAGRRLTGEFILSKDKRNAMSAEELETFNINKKAELERIKAMQSDMRALQPPSAIRTRLYRLHGTKAQFQFLRQQRGVARHLWNLCVQERDTRRANANWDYVKFLWWLLAQDDDPVTNAEARSINKNITQFFASMEPTAPELRSMYQKKAYWKNSGKEWGMSAPSNLYTSVIEQFVSNTTTARKKHGYNFKMKFASRKDDDVGGFSIAVDKQQIRGIVHTGIATPQAQHRSRRQRRQRIGPERRPRVRTGTPPPAQRDTRQEYAVRYMPRTCPGGGVFKVRARASEKFVERATHTDSAFKIVYQSGAWYLAVTSMEPIASVPSTAAQAVERLVALGMEEEVENENGHCVPARVASIDPGVKTAATVYYPQTGEVILYGTTQERYDVYCVCVCVV